ncbi:MAG: hypothetical protein IJS47_01060 [Clostridia bacterium]|nr:hypothetical protein [Clostridia bacterium]
MNTYIDLVENKNISSNEILVLVMNRNQSLKWRKRMELKSSNKIKRTSFFGFIQEEIRMYYPIILKECSDIKSYSVEPKFLTFEVSQYLLTKLIEQRRMLNNAFYDVASKDNRIAIDISSNLVKAASASLSYEKIGTRLYNSLEVKSDEKKEIYMTADKIISDYRRRCLECGVMDFAMALDLYNNILLRSDEYLTSFKNRIKYLIVDNLEEAVPSQIDFIEKILPYMTDSLIAYNNEGGYGSIFGANKEYVEQKLLGKCEIEKIDTVPYTCKKEMVEFSDMLFDGIETGKIKAKKCNLIERIPQVPLRSTMLFNVINYTKDLIKKGYKEENIAIISTYADPVTEYVLSSGLAKANINMINISRKNRFIDNKFVHALITLGYLCHPDEKIVPNRDDVKALIMMILDIDPVRSSILAGIVCSQNPFAKFPQVDEEGIIERIGYSNVQKYEFIRNWINDYREHEPLPIDEFFRKVFVEILLVYGANEEDIINIKRLIDSANTFDETVRNFHTIDVNKEFLKMIKNEVKAAESIFEMEEEDYKNSITFSTPMTYLSNSLEHKVIILIGLSSKNWLPRCVKELSNPYVLTSTWKDDDIYTESYEEENQKKNIAIIMRALLKRCSDKFVTFESQYSGDGFENEGMLSDVFDMIMGN